MKIVIAIDSLKGSLSSLEAGGAVKRAAQKIFPQCDISVFPLADGGEGTASAIAFSRGGKRVSLSVTGPLIHKVEAEYYILQDNTAVIEMSSAAGITLVSEEKRNPLNTTTYGVGELIKDAAAKGCRNFIIGIGGSATNDGGTGMLKALGFEFLDQEGKEIPLGAKGLSSLHKISDRNVLPQIKECSFKIACDVINPLCGESGCSAVFSPQKGAKAEDILKMDSWLLNYSRLAKKINPLADAGFPGSGAAGGLGFAFLAFTNATLQSGVDIVLENCGLEEKIKTADLVITGEGRLDGQTVMGKAPIGVARMAKKYQKKVIAFAGALGKGAELCLSSGIDSYYCITPKTMTTREAMKKENALKNMENTAKRVFEDL